MSGRRTMARAAAAAAAAAVVLPMSVARPAFAPPLPAAGTTPLQAAVAGYVAGAAVHEFAAGAVLDRSQVIDGRRHTCAWRYIASSDAMVCTFGPHAFENRTAAATAAGATE
jgi:hypothetical protein